uniref:DUF4219 domain-containing protein n=1 Tax=Oryza sativa subsp. japonica TaxID=39947 RepID=Q60EK9_ORYSJ|nr:hypothetical protein [Oryza sativa Japonica Group]AAV32110.1 hypothetical protein [Oryza sativa Japonica Group]
MRCGLTTVAVPCRAGPRARPAAQARHGYSCRAGTARYCSRPCRAVPATGSAVPRAARFGPARLATSRHREEEEATAMLTNTYTAMNGEEDGWRRDRDDGEVRVNNSDGFLVTSGGNRGVYGLRLGAAMPTTASGLTLCYPMLEENNYGVWAVKMKIFMRAQGVWAAVEGNTADEKMDQMALTAIVQAMPEAVVMTIFEKETAKAA